MIVPQKDGTSYGSGTLVDVKGGHGLVITNWHVVRDAGGEILVVFPGGFRSAAKVVKQDRDWDLAALMIWEPKGVKPVPLAPQAPQPGQPLTIAGYGGGVYRAAQGRCTQYVSPGMHHPFEMVELSAPARNGDSGGPILNESGQLAGVLFGTGRGRTSGSYSGRVGKFLASVVPDIMNPNRVRTPATPTQPSRGGEQLVAVPPRRESTTNRTATLTPAKPRPSVSARRTDLETTPFSASPTTTAQKSPESPTGNQLTWKDFAGETIGAQAKTVLAMFGALVVLVNIAKLLSKEE
ncbi:MAG: serine protease [Pirellulales bacterium]|nr:serine protease [Pirellulales bacterium]